MKQKEKRGKTQEKILIKKKKGFKTYTQQLSSRKVLYVISPQRKRVESGHCKFYLLHTDIFKQNFISFYVQNKMCFLSFSLFTHLIEQTSYMSQVSTQLEEETDQQVETLLGLGKESARARL